MKWRFWTQASSSMFEHKNGVMTCKEIQPLLSLYGDGMTSAQETMLVEAHLAQCEDCRAAQRCLQAIHGVLSRRPSVTPPDDLRMRISSAIAAQSKSPIVTPNWRTAQPAYAFALAAAVVMVAIWSFSHPVATPGLLKVASHRVATPSVHPLIASPKLMASLPKTSVKKPVVSLLKHAPVLVARLPKSEIVPSFVPMQPRQSERHFVVTTPPIVIATKPNTILVPHIAIVVHHSVVSETHIASVPKHIDPKPNIALTVPKPIVHSAHNSQVAKLPTAPEIVLPSVEERKPEMAAVSAATAPVHHDVMTARVPQEQGFDQSALQVVRNHVIASHSVSFTPHSTKLKYDGPDAGDGTGTLRGINGPVD